MSTPGTVEVSAADVHNMYYPLVESLKKDLADCRAGRMPASRGDLFGANSGGKIRRRMKRKTRAHGKKSRKSKTRRHHRKSYRK